MNGVWLGIFRVQKIHPRAFLTPQDLGVILFIRHYLLRCESEADLAGGLGLYSNPFELPGSPSLAISCPEERHEDPALLHQGRS
jgi:hypothetical protein